MNEDKEMNNIGKNIRRARIKKNMTMLELAKMINKTEATVQRYESGNIKNIPYEIIVSIASALRVSPSYLMGWQDLTFEVPEGDTIYKDDDFTVISKTRKISDVYKPVFRKQLLSMTEEAIPSRDYLINYLKGLPLAAFGGGVDLEKMTDDELYELYKKLTD